MFFEVSGTGGNCKKKKKYIFIFKVPAFFFKIKYCSKSARKLVCCVAQFIFLAQYCGITVIANILPGFFLSVYHCTVYPPEQAAGPVQKMQIFRGFFYQCITVNPPELAACPVKNANVQVFWGIFPLVLSPSSPSPRFLPFHFSIG